MLRLTYGGVGSSTPPYPFSGVYDSGFDGISQSTGTRRRDATRTRAHKPDRISPKSMSIYNPCHRSYELARTVTRSAQSLGEQLSHQSGGHGLNRCDRGRVEQAGRWMRRIVDDESIQIGYGVYCPRPDASSQHADHWLCYWHLFTPRICVVYC